MEEITKTYQEFKQELDKEFFNAANSFVRIGYLLRIAKDTDILHESGYANLNDFAKAEYGLDKSMVSRYIHINEKYSVNGYSEQIQTRYENYGVAKLAELLTLPDAIAEEIPPEMSKTQIQELRQELREEQQITDIEVALEEREPSQQNTTTLQKWMHKYFEEEKEVFRRVMEGVRRGERNKLFTEEQKAGILLDALVPSGVGVLTARVAGLGKLMLSIKSPKENLVLLNARNPEDKEEIGWQQLAEEFKNLYEISLKIPEAWEEVYGKPYEKEKKETVPKPQESVSKQSESVSESSETVPKQSETTPEPPADVMNPPEDIAEETEEVAPVQEQVEGQMEIHNYNEVLPEGEKFVPVFGEWVSARRKAVPDEEGNYLIYFKDIDGKFRKIIDNVFSDKDTGELGWLTYGSKALFWMPLPADPREEDY